MCVTVCINVGVRHGWRAYLPLWLFQLANLAAVLVLQVGLGVYYRACGLTLVCDTAGGPTSPCGCSSSPTWRPCWCCRWVSVCITVRVG